nr:hypothetical protein [Tanacetum cinerariifolium]
MIESSWIEAMQEKIHEFERLEKLFFGCSKQMASEQHGLEPKLQGLASGHISSGLMLNQCCIYPISAATLLPSNTAGPSSSTTIDQEDLSPSISPNNETTSPPINSTNVEKTHNKEVADFDSDTFTNLFAPLDTSSAESSYRTVDTSNMQTFHQPQIKSKR